MKKEMYLEVIKQDDYSLHFFVKLYTIKKGFKKKFVNCKKLTLAETNILFMPYSLIEKISSSEFLEIYKINNIPIRTFFKK